MKLNKRQKSGIAIFGIIAAVLVLTTLIIPFKKPGASWTMFAFSLISIASSAYICLLAFKNTKDLMSKFYGFPVFRIGVLYVVIQLALTVVIYIIGAFVDVPFWVGFLLSVLLGGAAAIGSLQRRRSSAYLLCEFLLLFTCPRPVQPGVGHLRTFSCMART